MKNWQMVVLFITIFLVIFFVFRYRRLTLNNLSQVITEAIALIDSSTFDKFVMGDGSKEYFIGAMLNVSYGCSPVSLKEVVSFEFKGRRNDMWILEYIDEEVVSWQKNDTRFRGRLTQSDHRLLSAELLKKARSLRDLEA